MYATTLPTSNWLRRASIRLAWYRHMPASSWLYIQLRMLKSLFKDIEHQTLTTSIIAKTLISLPPVTQELFKDTLIALKSCLSMPVSVATCERSFSALRRLKTYLRSTMKKERHSLYSPSRPQWQSRQFGFFFSVWNTSCWKMRKEQKSLAIPIIYSATVDIKEIRITKSVLVLQDSTENWLNCWAYFVDDFVSIFCHYGFS